MESLSTTDEDVSEERYAWIEEIDNPKILKAVKDLTEDQLELVTMLAFDGMNQTEIAKVFGVSQQSISKKIKKSKKFFKNGCKKGVFVAYHLRG